MRSIKRAGVPTPIPILYLLRNSTCSSTFMCLANCGNVSFRNAVILPRRTKRGGAYQFTDSAFLAGEFSDSPVSGQWRVPKADVQFGTTVPGNVGSPEASSCNNEGMWRSLPLGRLHQFLGACRESFQEIRILVQSPRLLPRCCIPDGTGCTSRSVRSKATAGHGALRETAYLTWSSPKSRQD